MTIFKDSKNNVVQKIIGRTIMTGGGGGDGDIRKETTMTAGSDIIHPIVGASSPLPSSSSSSSIQRSLYGEVDGPNNHERSTIKKATGSKPDDDGDDDDDDNHTISSNPTSSSSHPSLITPPPPISSSSILFTTSHFIKITSRIVLTTTIGLYILNQKHMLPKPLSSIVSRVLFWPTLPITVSRRLGRWITPVDDVLVLGGAPLGFCGVPGRLYRDYNVRGVVNMCDEYRGPTRQYDKLGMTELHLRTVDHFEPSFDDLKSAVAFLNDYEKRGEKVYVHCRAGHGRSAAVAFAWLLYKNPNVDPKQLNHDLCQMRNVRDYLWRQPNLKMFQQWLKKGGRITTNNGGGGSCGRGKERRVYDDDSSNIGDLGWDGTRDYGDDSDQNDFFVNGSRDGYDDDDDVRVSDSENDNSGRVLSSDDDDDDDVSFRNYGHDDSYDDDKDYEMWKQYQTKSDLDSTSSSRSYSSNK